MEPTAVSSDLFTARTIVGIMFLVLGITASAQNAEVWQGSFETRDLWGAMELEVADVSGRLEVRARFTPQGHLETSPVREGKISKDQVSFVAALNGVDYRFTGQQKRGRWTGTIEGSGSKGAWTLTRVLPVMTSGSSLLPRPTGRMAVGRIDFHWKDDKREELETRDAEDHRQLMVYVFYPAQHSDTPVRADYLPDVDVMRGDWTDVQIATTRTVGNYSLKAAPCIRKGSPFPVVIFAPGGGQKALSYTTLLADLASHGYIVAAIDPPYNASAVQFSDGTVLKRLPPAERGWETPKVRDDMPRIYEQMVVHWARDMSFILDRLTELTKQDGRFAGKIDVQHVGAFGHSRGGQAAGKVRLLDSRFDAGLNLDGNIRGRGFPPDPTFGGGKQPFLWLEKQLPWPKKDLEGLTLPQFEDMWANGDRLMQSIASESIRMVIARPEIDHLDFGDTAILNAALSPQSRGGKQRTLTITRRVVLAFFDSHLKGANQPHLELLAKEYPEIRLKRYRAASLPQR